MTYTKIPDTFSYLGNAIDVERTPVQGPIEWDHKEYGFRISIDAKGNFKISRIENR